MDKKIWYNTILNALVYKYTIYKALIIRDDIQSNQLIAIHSDLLMVTRIKKLRCLINHYFFDNINNDHNMNILFICISNFSIK